MSATTMRPRRIGEILDAAIKVYVRNARTLMGLAAVVAIPMQAISAVVLLSTLPSGSDVPTGTFTFSPRASSTADPAAVAGGQATLLVLSLLVSALVTAASVKAVSDAYVDQPTGIAVSLRFALRRLPAVIVMEILMVLGLILAFILLIIPGIWLYGLWSVAVPALLIERTGPVRALGRSRRLVRGRWWPTAGVLLVAAIMASLIGGVIEALLVGIAGLPSQPSLLIAVIVTTLAGAISSIVVTPFRAAVTTVLYYDLRVRKEGFDLQLLADQLGLPSPSDADGTATGDPRTGAAAAAEPLPVGPESVGQPGGPPFWPPPADWRPSD